MLVTFINFLNSFNFKFDVIKVNFYSFRSIGCHSVDELCEGVVRHFGFCLLDDSQRFLDAIANVKNLTNLVIGYFNLIDVLFKRNPWLPCYGQDIPKLDLNLWKDAY